MDFRDQDRLLRHTTLLMAATLVVNFTNILFQMLMMRRLPVAEYGVMAAMFGLIVMVATPLEAVRTAAAHFSARLCQAGHAGQIRAFVRGWSKVTVWAAVVVVIAGMGGSGILMSFFRLDSPSVILAVTIVMAFLLFTPLLAGALQGAQAFRWLAVVWMSWGVVRLAAGAALVLWVSATAMSAVVAQGMGTLACVATGCVGLFVVLRAKPAGTDPVSGGLPYLVNSLFILFAYSVLMTADVSMVKHFFPADEAGLFARAATIGRSIIFLPMPVAMAMFPKVVSEGRTSDNDWRTLRRALAYAGCLILTVGLAGCLLARFGWLVFAGHWPDSNSLKLVRLLLVAMAPLGLTYLVMNFELAQRRFRTAWFLVPCAAAYVAGVWAWHDTLWQVVAVMGCVNAASVVLPALGMLRRAK